MKKTVLVLSILLGYFASLAQGPCVTTFTDPSLTVGYRITFETLTGGTDIKATLELLDKDKTGELAFIREPEPGLNQMQMTKDAVNKWSIVLKPVGGMPIPKTHNFYIVLMGGGERVTQFVDYEVGDDCSATNDVAAPTDFTATLGNVTDYSVAFSMNAKDNAGTVIYYIEYNGKTVAKSAASNAATTVVVSGLEAETKYDFSVYAGDLAGNNGTATDLTTTTTADTNTACAGAGFESEIGSFDVGYRYKFETLASGTDVKLTLELLDEDRGLAGANWWCLTCSSTGGFDFGAMTLVSGQEYTTNISGVSTGEVIKYSCEFIVAGGSLVPKYQEYTVGDDCLLSVRDLDASAFQAYPNPTTNTWTIRTQNSTISSIQLVDLMGKQVMMATPLAGEAVMDAADLIPGVYFARLKTAAGTSTVKLIKE
ncbi:T9SS type A sorting domain-containing protein [Bacteroidia bacterium]|nr:T9SS type A sorting domain-containing protein [Bacteroidia bacterium]